MVEKSVGARVLFVTWGSLGDLHPYISLALELQRRGHQPAIATVAGYREMVEGAGLRCHSIRPDVSLDDKQEFQRLVRRVLDARDGPRFLFQAVLNPALRDTYEDTLVAIVQLFEVLDGFGLMKNVYDRLDLAANTAGIALASILDVIAKRMSGGRSARLEGSNTESGKVRAV